ncbi:MAG: LD-carboxypeptidase [Deltaproteobacteria bacterium]|nr:LD-carboxypeptidase [Deltaproteobacteria bacterium]
MIDESIVSSTRVASAPRAALLISPAGPIKEEVLDRGLASAEELGIPITWPEGWRTHVLKTDGFFAGSDDERSRCLREAIDGGHADLWMSRGGYGCIRTLEAGQDQAGALTGRRRSTLWGFSDGTALLAAWDRRGWPAWHAPPVSQLPRLDGLSRASLELAWKTGQAAPIPNLTTEVPGRARGPIAGGNLAVLTSLIGTPWAADLRDRIVLLEDVGEAPYAIDRMLTQLILSGALQGALGFIIGQFTGLSERSTADAFRVVRERLEPLGLPMVTGAPVGHDAQNVPLPFGAGSKLLAVLEASVDGDATIQFEPNS